MRGRRTGLLKSRRPDCSNFQRKIDTRSILTAHRAGHSTEFLLKKFSIILTLSTLLASATVSHAASPSAEAAPQDLLPNVTLSEQLIYKYLSAELSFQRGEIFAAYSTMASLARSTGDARLARRALEFAATGSLPVEALKAARLWRELAPRSDEAAQALVGLLIANAQLDEAKSALAQQLAASAPAKLPLAIANVQRQLSRISDRARAQAMLRELLEPYRQSLDAQMALIQTAMVAGDRPTALREARAALEKNPESELAALLLAQIIEDKAEATKSLGDFLKKNPKSREVRLAYARMLIEQSRLPDAKAEFALILKQFPEDQTTLYALGLLATQAGELKDAEKYLSAYVRTLGGKPDPERDSSQALMVLAQLAEERNDLRGALDWLERIDPANQTSYLGATMKRAQLLAKSGNLEAARTLLHSADVSSDDERIKLIIGEAQLLRDSGRLDEALKLVGDALDTHKDSVDLLYEHAMLAEKANQLDLMESQLRRVIKLAPNNQHAYNALGYSLADRNVRLQEAYDLISKANQLAPADPYILDSLGWVEFRLGRYEDALSTLRRAFEIKADPEIAAHLGEVLWKLGREDEARTLWRSANAKDPKNETLKGTLQRLQVKL
jgi:tetratricopeptide (TPR) repeat protein